MSFETTVSGPVTESVLPNGEVQVNYTCTHGAFFQLLFFLYFLVSLILLISATNVPSMAFVAIPNAALCAWALYLLLNKKQSFIVVPNQGIRFKGNQIAFTDITTIRSVKNTKAGSKLYIVVRGKDIFLAEAKDSVISAISTALKSHSTVSYS